MKTKVQDLYAACSSFGHIVAFFVLFNGLELLKILVVKPQKRIQDESFDMKQFSNKK